MSSFLAPSLAKPISPPEPAGFSPARVWRDVVQPREHGSWSLAFEPVALALIAAPSAAAGLLALAVAAGFFARRPLRLVWREKNPVRRAAARAALLMCGAMAVACVGGAIMLSGFGWLSWLAPTALLGAIFLRYDLDNESRDGVAEMAGSAAFGFLPAAFAIVSRSSAATALGLAFVMLARAVPTVLVVRACLRAAKSGERRLAVPLAASIGAVLAAAGLYAFGRLPVTCLILLGLLATRAAVLLLAPTPFRARTIGIFEAGLGAVYVVASGLALH